MKQKLKSVLTHPLLAGSLVMFLGSNLSNFFQYLYHPLMGRMLGIAKYGEMSALFSLTILIGTVPSTLSLVIIKYISSAKSETEISRFLNWIYPKSYILGGLIFILCFIFSKPISHFLNISDPRLIWLISLLFIFNFPLIVLRSALQGLTKFNMYSVSMIVDSAFKLLFGYILVSLGFSLFGAIIGVVISSLCSWIVSHVFISSHLGQVMGSRINLKPLIIYSFPVILNIIASSSLFSTDMVLVKHFFDPETAGIYASLGTIGKMILFGTGPIAAVMFPLVSRRQASGQKFLKIFLGGFAITILVSSSVVICFTMFPEFIINLMFGPRFLSVVPYLSVYSLAMMMYALGAYLVSYNLSLNKIRIVILPAIAAVIQVSAIILYHNTLWQVVNISLCISITLLISLAIYTFNIVKYPKSTVRYATS